MEAVEPLSGFKVGGPPTYPQTKSGGGVNIFFYIITYYVKKFFFNFPIYSLQDLELPPRSKFRSVAYETTLE